MSESGASVVSRAIPSVDKLLNDPALSRLREKYSEEIVKLMVRRAVDELREEIRDGKLLEAECSAPALATRAEKLAAEAVGSKLRTVITQQASWCIRTSEGRLCQNEWWIGLPQPPCRIRTSSTTLRKGIEGSATPHLRRLMQELTGAEATLAVNNNAAAVLLCPVQPRPGP